jgi:hypothetical protein
MYKTQLNIALFSLVGVGSLSAVLKMCDSLADEIHMNVKSVMDKTSSKTTK